MNPTLLIGLLLGLILLAALFEGDDWDGSDGTPPPGMGY